MTGDSSDPVGVTSETTTYRVPLSLIVWILGTAGLAAYIGLFAVVGRPLDEALRLAATWAIVSVIIAFVRPSAFTVRVIEE